MPSHRSLRLAFLVSLVGLAAGVLLGVLSFPYSDWLGIGALGLQSQIFFALAPLSPVLLLGLLYVRELNQVLKTVSPWAKHLESVAGFVMRSVGPVISKLRSEYEALDLKS